MHGLSLAVMNHPPALHGLGDESGSVDVAGLGQGHWSDGIGCPLADDAVRLAGMKRTCPECEEVFQAGRQKLLDS